MLLGTDAAAMPAAPESPGLATALFRRLDDAMSDVALLNALHVPSTVSG